MKMTRDGFIPRPAKRAAHCLRLTSQRKNPGVICQEVHGFKATLNGKRQCWSMQNNTATASGQISIIAYMARSSSCLHPIPPVKFS